MTFRAGMGPEAVAARALEMYRRAAQQGNVEAELRLGDYCYYGWGQAADMERAVAHYRTASEARSAQAMFNLAYMYAHGHGLTRDYHLAKRHYDLALETHLDAWAPVHLALLELKLLQWWEARTGGAHGDPYDYLAAAAAPSLDALATLEYDTLLILALSLTLGVVLLVRQRQNLT